MVRHIVLFRLKDDPRKQEVMNAFKNAIEALPKKLDIIRDIHVSFNINPAEAYDIALVSEFDTLDDVKRYSTFPDHVAAGKLLADLKISRACVDYEL
jgi:hypothetical protein